ncbi:MAG: hypothetical protein LBR29_06595 [Methylobacteriaceae bacterium]|jgi:predicted acyltransferase|nr:hypothetical protein [Methylobacteriaceae bacterium]
MSFNSLALTNNAGAALHNDESRSAAFVLGLLLTLVFVPMFAIHVGVAMAMNDAAPQTQTIVVAETVSAG